MGGRRLDAWIIDILLFRDVNYNRIRRHGSNRIILCLWNRRCAWFSADVICFIVLHIWVRVSTINFDRISTYILELQLITTYKYTIYSHVRLTLLSLCINLMQEQLIGKVKWLAAEVGLGGGKARYPFTFIFTILPY